YSGTVILVSHDRDFLDRTVTSVLAPDGDGRWLEYAGGYTDMLAQRRGVEPVKSGDDKGRREGETRDKATAASATSPVPASLSAPKRKLSYKEKHALQSLPGTITRLETEIAALQGRLADA